MDDLETRLQEWGHHVSAGQGRLDIDWKDVERAATRSRLFGGAAPLISAGVLVVGVLVIGLALGNAPPQRGSQVLTPGDTAEAVGALVQQADGSFVVCVRAATRLPYTGRPPACSSIAVPVVGLDPATVPGWVALDGGGYAEYVTVRGPWTAAGLQATMVTAGPSTTLVATSPCSAAEIIGNEGSALGQEAATARVDGLIGADAATYAGAWPAVDGQGRGLLVVGTTGDVAFARATVAALYPYRLCVTRVANSLAQLNDLLSKVTRDHPEWLPTVALEANAVKVQVAVFDDAAVSITAAYGQGVVVDALVHRP